MGLFNSVKNAGEKLWDMVTGNHDIADLVKRVREHLNGTGIPDADKVDVQISEGKATVFGGGLSQEAKEKILIAIGNISGIASVDGQVKAFAPVSENRFYTVKSGDTLSAIAKQVYDNVNLYNQIFKTNKSVLENPDKIYPGQASRIPEQ